MRSGHLLIIIAAIGFGLNPMLAQVLMGDGLSAELVTLYRYFLPALVLVPWLRLDKTEYTEGLVMFVVGLYQRFVEHTGHSSHFYLLLLPGYELVGWLGLIL